MAPGGSSGYSQIAEEEKGQLLANGQSPWHPWAGSMPLGAGQGRQSQALPLRGSTRQWGQGLDGRHTRG